MYVLCIQLIVNEKMRTTINIDDNLLDSASSLTGITEKTALVPSGLKALISLESAKRLADLGGSQSNINIASRRQTEISLDEVAEDAANYSTNSKE